MYLCRVVARELWRSLIAFERLFVKTKTKNKKKVTLTLASELVFHTAKYNVRQRNKKKKRKKKYLFGVFTPVVVCIEQFPTVVN